MGGKAGSRHLKRSASPPMWPIPRKRFTWTFKPIPGPHGAQKALTLGVIMRDMLGFAYTAREVSIALSERRVRVDGAVRNDPKYPVGLMDVIELPDANLSYRVLPSNARDLSLVRIPKDEAKFKISRIENKATLKNGLIQLNLHDGRNILLSAKPGALPTQQQPKTMDTLRLAIPTQKILGHYPFTEGSYGLIVGGSNLGRHGKLVKIERGSFSRRGIVTLESSDGGNLETVYDYVFVIGEEKPAIKMP